MVELPAPEAGLVIRYGFVWRSQADAGREDAGKSRPCAIVVVVLREEKSAIVTVTPVTHTPPDADALAVEIPLGVKRRLGLDGERSWIITRELNTFVWPGPDVDVIDPNSETRRIAYGHLPKQLYFEVLRAVQTHVRTGRANVVRRSR